MYGPVDISSLTCLLSWWLIILQCDCCSACVNTAYDCEPLRVIISNGVLVIAHFELYTDNCFHRRLIVTDIAWSVQESQKEIWTNVESSRFSRYRVCAHARCYIFIGVEYRRYGESAYPQVSHEQLVDYRNVEKYWKYYDISWFI